MKETPMDLSDHLKKVGKEVVRLDFYLLKRAFGVYYATWAAAIFTLTILSYISGITEQSDTYLTLYGLLDIGVIIVAVDYTRIVFRKAHMLSRLESDLQMSKSFKTIGNNVNIGILIVLIVMFAIIGTNIFPGDLNSLLTFIILWIVDLYVYMVTRISFGKVQPEVILAVGTFGFSNTASCLEFLLTGNSVYSFPLWLVTVIGWSISSLYSFYKAGEIHSTEIGESGSRFS
ncbi:MAG: hypothetical protein M1414_05710 [Candidatus Thermoplasmatota archaeon]|jgi:hypothetical protein|nr:hypothetical protein [Candidatus Thermoplasmatota archaeon]